MALVECVPNFSDGRDREIVNRIIDSISTVKSVKILDMEMDPDHNRSVVTFVCPPEDAVEAAFRGIKSAAELIDMNTHRGEHPRFGASDVVPFVPIEGVTIKECAELAVKLGERVGKELSIPVYMYSEAAKIADRRNLENIRSKSFQVEQLREHISEEKWKPDFGPAEIGRAGATIIGARDYLIAYNVNLPTTDLAVGKKIAKAMRGRDGGLSNIKALAFSLNDRKLTQISMNLTSFRKTPIYRAFEAVKTEAARYGLSPVESEIVGLVPLDAVVGTVDYYLRLNGFSRSQVLEEKVRGNEGETLDGFMKELASSSSTPGGGSASAMVSMVSAALASMVSLLTVGKEKYRDSWEEMERLSIRASEISRELRKLMYEDVTEFNKIVSAWKLPKKTDREKEFRKGEIEKASIGAIRVPWRIAALSREILDISAVLVRRGNTSAVTDSLSAVTFSIAAIKSSLYNVLINLNSISDMKMVESEKMKVRMFIEDASRTSSEILAQKEKELGL